MKSDKENKEPTAKRSHGEQVIMELLEEMIKSKKRQTIISRRESKREVSSRRPSSDII